MAEVIGAAFLGLTTFIKKQKGENLLKEVIKIAGTSTEEIFAKRILTVGWYPYEGYAKFLNAVVGRIGGGDITFARQMGVIAAKRDLETIYSEYKSKSDPV